MVLVNNVFLIILVLTSAIFDAKERRIPNKITFTGIIIGLLINLIIFGWSGLFNSFIGLLAGMAIFFVPFVMGGIGAGDVKLMGAIGAMMGWKFSVMTALYSAVIGGVMVFIYLIYVGKLRETLEKLLYDLVNLLIHHAIRLGYNEMLYKAHKRLSKNGNNYRKIYIPYGVAIASGAITVLIAYKQGLSIF